PWYRGRTPARSSQHPTTPPHPVIHRIGHRNASIGNFSPLVEMREIATVTTETRSHLCSKTKTKSMPLTSTDGGWGSARARLHDCSATRVFRESPSTSAESNYQTCAMRFD